MARIEAAAESPGRFTAVTVGSEPVETGGTRDICSLSLALKAKDLRPKTKVGDLSRLGKTRKCLSLGLRETVGPDHI